MYKPFISLIFLTIIGLSVSAQREFKMTEGDTTFVMKRYVFMLLEKGPERS